MALPSTPTGRVLLGARTALGITTLLAPRIAGKLFFLDPDDFLVITAEWRRGAVPGPAAVLMAGTALGATALGALSLSGESEQPD